MKIVVTGATGYIGAPLVKALVGRGDSVLAFSRDGARAKAKLGVDAVTADLQTLGDWQKHLDGVDAVIHLAGESVAGKRWDTRYKQVLRDSRVESTHNIVQAIEKLPAAQRPRVLLSASGSDYYPFADEEFDEDEFAENEGPGDHFLGRLCAAWEREALAAREFGVRVVTMRTGIVLGEGGGALEKMQTAFKFFVGGPLGGGKQWFPWLHLDDAVKAYVFALDNAELSGPVNLVAPQPVRQKDFAKALGRSLGRPSFLPTPGFAIKAAVGAEFAEYLLSGRKVVPRALQKAGYVFARPDLAEALARR